MIFDIRLDGKTIYTKSRGRIRIGYDDPRSYLPKRIIKALDVAFKEIGVGKTFRFRIPIKETIYGWEYINIAAPSEAEARHQLPGYQ